MINKVKLTPVTLALRRMDGLEVPGGCEECDAVQTVTSPAYGLTGVSMVTVHHDDGCAWLARAGGPAPSPAWSPDSVNGPVPGGSDPST